MSARDPGLPAGTQPSPSPAPRRRRGRAPADVEAVPADAWRALYAAALRYRDAAPWDWLSDSEIVGVRDPLTGETAWCAALGAAGEIFGLLAHRGVEGYDVHRRLQANRLAPGEALFAQKALLIDFTDRAGLDRSELARLRALGLSFRGSNAWPRVESHEPGWVPAPPDLPGVRLLTHAVEQALDVFRRAETDPSLVEPDAEGRLLVRAVRGPLARRGAAGAAAGDEASTWSDTREAPPAPPPPEAPARLDDLVLQRRRDEWPSSPATLEFAAVHTLATIADRGPRPYFAIAALLVDSESGTIVDATVAGPPLTAQLLSDIVLQALGKLGSRPARIHVQTEKARVALQPLASGLGIELRRVRQMPALDEAVASLVPMLERG